MDGQSTRDITTNHFPVKQSPTQGRGKKGKEREVEGYAVGNNDAADSCHRLEWNSWWEGVVVLRCGQIN